MLLLLAAVFFIYAFVSDRYIRRRFGIQADKSFFYRHVNRVHKRAEMSLLLVFLITVWFSGEHLVLFIASFIIITFGIRTFMEWKYAREKKEYYLTFNDLFVITAFVAAGYGFHIF